MYATYVYAAGATRANVLSDVTAILTGETNKTNLSAACVQASTSIVSTIASGWAVHDSSPATDSKVIKAPHSDEGSVYKLAYLNISDTLLKVDMCISWDEVAHTGVKSAASIGQVISVTSGGTVFIYASARFFALYSEYYNSSGVKYSGATTYGGPSGIFEMSRIAPWLTVGSGYSKSVVIMSFGHQCYDKSGGAFGKVKNPSNSDDTFTSATAYFPGFAPNAISSNLTGGPSAKIRNSSGGIVIPTFPLLMAGFSYSTLNCVVGDVSASSDVWWAPSAVIPDHAEFTINAKKYRYVPASIPGGTTAAALLIPSE